MASDQGLAKMVKTAFSSEEPGRRENRAALSSVHAPLWRVVARYGTYPVQEKEKQSRPTAALNPFLLV